MEEGPDLTILSDVTFARFYFQTLCRKKDPAHKCLITLLTVKREDMEEKMVMDSNIFSVFC